MSKLIIMIFFTYKTYAADIINVNDFISPTTKGFLLLVVYHKNVMT